MHPMNLNGSLKMIDYKGRYISFTVKLAKTNLLTFLKKYKELYPHDYNYNTDQINITLAFYYELLLWRQKKRKIFYPVAVRYLTQYGAQVIN